MPISFTEEQAAAAQNGRTSTGQKVAELGQTATSFAGEGKDAIYGIGTNATNNWLQNTSTYQKIQNSERLGTIRKSDVVAKINKGNKAVDDFSTRTKDNAVAKVKDAYGWTKKTLRLDKAADKVKGVFHGAKAKFHIGKHAKVAAGNASAGVEAGTVNAAEGAAANGVAAGGEALNGAEMALTKTVTKAPSMMGRAFGALGKVGTRLAIPFALTVGAFQTKNALKEHDGHKAAKAAGGTVGGIIGGIIMGSMEGAVLGLILTGPFAFLGSLVLGLAGAVIGGYIGSKATDTIAGNAIQKHLDKQKPQELAQHAPAKGHAETIAVNEPETSGPESNRFRSRIALERQQAMSQQTSPVHS